MEFRRKHERITFLADAQVTSLKERTSFVASIITLGRQGLGMFAHGFLENNTLVEILITFKDSSGSTQMERVQGRVTGVRVGVDGNTFGIELHEKLDREKNPALFQYLDQFQSRTP